MYSESFSVALNALAAAVGANSQDLKALIQFESTWNPLAYNSSGAVGLIQFMPQTLKDFKLLPTPLNMKVPTNGAVPEAVKQEVRQWFTSTYPTVEAQLSGPVTAYFMRYKPYPTQQSLFMAVFYPSYRYVSPDTMFSTSIQSQNPGIDTVQSYIDFVKKKSIPKPFWKKLLHRH
jgi:hypothetical protein